MSVGARTPIHVVLVEDRADRPTGHYAPAIRRLAEGFVAAGYPVTVLTSLGLSVDAAGTTGSTYEVRRFGPVGRGLERLVRRVDDLPARHRWRRPLRHLSVRTRSLLILGEARRLARQLGGPEDVVVIVSGTSLSPMMAAWFAPALGRWISYRHDRARRSTPRPSRVGAGAEHLAARITTARVRRRVHRGGVYVLAGTFPDLVDSWQPRLPQVPMGSVGLAVAPSVDRPGGRGEAAERDDRVAARRQLGLPTTGPLALFFGALHPGKAPDTVWAAWAGPTPPDAGLVAAGAGVAASLARWSAGHPDADLSNIHVFDGAIPDDTKHLMFRAADLGVLSFLARPLGASATLGEFITHERPVCCSSGGDPAMLVDRYGVGVVYEVESSPALVAAVHDLLEHPPPARAFVEMQADHAEPQLARQMLDLLELATG